MITPEMVSVIKDNENCNDHGNDIYMQMIEYVSYEGEYEADTHPFVYTADGAESYADGGDMIWICGDCDSTVDWVADLPQAEAQ